MSRWLKSAACPFRLVLFALFAGVGCGGDGGSGAFTLTLTPTEMQLLGFWDVEGTVRLSREVPRGTLAHLYLGESRPQRFQDADARVSGSAPRATDEVAFRIRSLDKGTYFLFVWVDLDRNGQLGPGDLGGYFDGSQLTPNQQPAAATPLQLEFSRFGVDFGIGPINAVP